MSCPGPTLRRRGPGLSDEQRELVASLPEPALQGVVVGPGAEAEPEASTPPSGRTCSTPASSTMGVPEDRGGWGASVLDLALVAELVGAAAAPVPVVEAQVAARLLAAVGSSPARRRCAGPRRRAARQPRRAPGRRSAWPSCARPARCATQCSCSTRRAAARARRGRRSNGGGEPRLRSAGRRPARRGRRSWPRAPTPSRRVRARPRRVAGPHRRGRRRQRHRRAGAGLRLRSRAPGLRLPDRVLPGDLAPVGRRRDQPRRRPAPGPRGGVGARPGRCSGPRAGGHGVRVRVHGRGEGHLRRPPHPRRLRLHAGVRRAAALAACPRVAPGLGRRRRRLPPGGRARATEGDS